MDTELSEVETQLLEALFHKGPALPVELAIRTLSFPDEVSTPIRALAEKGLIEIEPLARGPIGGELVYLSKAGRKKLNHRAA